MRNLLLAVGLAAVATPAFADPLQEVTTHGMIVSVGDRRFEVDYTPDGRERGPGDGLLAYRRR